MAASRTHPRAVLGEAESELLDLAIEASRADWVQATYINDDTEAVAAKASVRLMAATARWARAVARLPVETLSPAEVRRTQLLRTSLTTVAPSDPSASLELARTVNGMQALYARARYAPLGTQEPVDLQALSRILTEVREPAVLQDAWCGWHRVGREIRRPFARYVELANEGARELEFPDLGALWRSRYDMPPDDFARDVERLWNDVRPLYEVLHAYVREKLRSVYGGDRVPKGGPIPAHLLGNMWAQSWEGIYPLVAPPDTGAGYDLTRLLVERGTTPVDMVRYAERFFVSLGLAPLPATFWERSMFVRPRDREVVCHASAWDIDFANDLRIKMCIEITADDFSTIHHELGHNYYQRAYASQPYLFRESAHDGFHEAIGDTIALSVTPEYLVRIGLLPEAPDVSHDLGLLLYRALEKIAFLPFGLLVDRWRWDVFSGAIPASEYNRTWWEHKLRYQGVGPPTPRSESEFDPGAKFHVAAGVPYMRYFLAHLLEFQLHRALTRTAGATGPLHRASIYGSSAAGNRLGALLEMGASRPWPEALEVVTGERRLEARGLLEYFAPLQRWLVDETRHLRKGW